MYIVSVEMKKGSRSSNYRRARDCLVLICVLGFTLIAQLPETHAQRRRPLQVALSASPPSPTPIYTGWGQLPRITLTATVTGGQPPQRGLVTKYSFYATYSPTLQEDGLSRTVVWLPQRPCTCTVQVVVRQFQGNQKVAEANTTIGYSVVPLASKVTLQVSPPSGQAVAPPPIPAARLTMLASAVLPVLPPNIKLPGKPPSQLGGTRNLFTFSINPGYGSPEIGHFIGTTEPSASWTPDPPQPATPGTYVLKVSVQTQRLPDYEIIAQGSAEIPNYPVLGGRFTSFTKDLYPIYAHRRCVFCHGGVNPVNPPPGGYHPQTTAPCGSCHTTPGWTNVGADPYTAVVGYYQPKSAGEICNIVKNSAQAASRPTFLDFVQNFSLIKWAYSPTLPALGLEPPPGGQDYFVLRSMQWFDAGKPCP